MSGQMGVSSPNHWHDSTEAIPKGHSKGQVIPILGISNIWIVLGNWTSEFQIKVMDKQKILRSLSPCFTPKEVLLKLKGCVRYIFSSLVSMSNKEHLWNRKKCFLFHFESSFRSWDNQIFKFSDIPMSWRHQMPKHDAQNTFYWITWEVITVW